MKIFIASSFAYADPEVSRQRKETIEKAEAILLARGYEVFVPHKHMLEDAWEMSNHAWGEAVAKMDKENIISSDIVVLLTYGKERNNSGVAFESGVIDGVNLFRKAHGEKPIRLVLVKMNDETESLMMWSACDVAIRGVEALKDVDFFVDQRIDDVKLS